VGSVGLAAVLVRALFPALLVFGWVRGELAPRASAAFMCLGALAWLGLPRLLPGQGDLVTTALAILDIALVLKVFKGDVRIT
jgi:hypothetical protein